MNHRTRMQNRRLRSTGWDPIAHNRHVAMRKRLRQYERDMRRLGLAWRALGRAAEDAGVQLRQFGEAIGAVK
jgi:hypothetical protein